MNMHWLEQFKTQQANLRISNITANYDIIDQFCNGYKALLNTYSHTEIVIKIYSPSGKFAERAKQEIPY